MTRDATIEIRTTQQNKDRLEVRADQDGQSLSEYGHQLFEDHLYGSTNGATPAEMREEMKHTLADLRVDLTAILSEFRSEIGPELRDAQSVRTAYIIAIWKLLESEYSTQERQYAMQVAAAHTGVDPALVSVDPSSSAEPTDGEAAEQLVPGLESVSGAGSDGR